MDAPSTEDIMSALADLKSAVENMATNMATKADLEGMAMKSDANFAHLSRQLLGATNVMALPEFRNVPVLSNTTYENAILQGEEGGTWTLMKAKVR
jgi:hypothetical protein